MESKLSIPCCMMHDNGFFSCKKTLWCSLSNGNHVFDSKGILAFLSMECMECQRFVIWNGWKSRNMNGNVWDCRRQGHKGMMSQPIWDSWMAVVCYVSNAQLALGAHQLWPVPHSECPTYIIIPPTAGKANASLQLVIVYANSMSKRGHWGSQWGQQKCKPAQGQKMKGYDITGTRLYSSVWSSPKAHTGNHVLDKDSCVWSSLKATYRHHRDNIVLCIVQAKGTRNLWSHFPGHKLDQEEWPVTSTVQMQSKKIDRHAM